MEDATDEHCSEGKPKNNKNPYNNDWLVFQLFLRQNIKPDHSMIYKNTDIPMKNP
jgi:hypothetical protein